MLPCVIVGESAGRPTTVCGGSELMSRRDATSGARSARVARTVRSASIAVAVGNQRTSLMNGAVSQKAAPVFAAGAPPGLMLARR